MKIVKRFKAYFRNLKEEERKRRKREFILIGVLLFLIVIIATFQTAIVNREIEVTVSSAILMFILFNINLIILLTLIFFIFRNVAKLYYERKHKLLGTKLQTKLVVAFTILTFIPSIILFFFATNFITKSIEFWFQSSVEHTIQYSVKTGDRLAKIIEENNKFFLERVAREVDSKKLLLKQNEKTLKNYVQVVQKTFNINTVGIYKKDGKRYALAMDDKFKEKKFPEIELSTFYENLKERKIRTVIKKLPKNEFIETIGTIPFGVNPIYANGFVVLTTYVGPNFSKDLLAIAKGFKNYRQTKILKSPIQTTYFVALSIVLILVVLMTFWFSFYIARHIIKPISELLEGTKKIAEGDLTYRIETETEDEISELVNSFNKMTKDIQKSREKLQISEEKLRKQNEELLNSKQYIEIILQNMSTGVISVDAEGFITTINNSAKKLLQIEQTDVLNKNFTEILSPEQIKTAQKYIDKTTFVKNGLNFSFSANIKNNPKNFSVYLNVLESDKKIVGYIIVFDDLTEIEKAHRMLAWREVARRIAHEVKNPLTPIVLSTERLYRKFGKDTKDPVFKDCLDMIKDNVDIIKKLTVEFADFAKFPTTNLEQGDIVPIIETSVELYKEECANITFKITKTSEIPHINLDKGQMKQVMINLLENAIFSIGKEKGEVFIAIVYRQDIKNVTITVADTGSGVANYDKSRLFEPYYSTKSSGTGLGLAIVHTIIKSHNGKIRVEDNEPKGVKFIIELPI